MYGCRQIIFRPTIFIGVPSWTQNWKIKINQLWVTQNLLVIWPLPVCCAFLWFTASTGAQVQQDPQRGWRKETYNLVVNYLICQRIFSYPVKSQWLVFFIWCCQGCNSIEQKMRRAKYLEYNWNTSLKVLIQMWISLETQGCQIDFHNWISSLETAID